METAGTLSSRRTRQAAMLQRAHVLVLLLERLHTVIMRSFSIESTARSAENPALRPCDHPGCAAAGDFRAPRSKSELDAFYWFCLAHVRAYNAAWNYYAGMSEAEIEAEIRSDTVWQRPSWRLGERHGPGPAIRDHFGVYEGNGHGRDGHRGNGHNGGHANGHGRES